MRVQFRGSITGSVVVRPGETREQAVTRALIALDKLVDERAASLRVVFPSGLTETTKEAAS